MRSSTPRPTSPTRSGFPASARARRRSRSSPRASVGRLSGRRPCAATWTAGSGTRQRRRASGRSRTPRSTSATGRPRRGETFRFTATVAVVPKPELADWTELEVGVPEAEVPRSSSTPSSTRCAPSVAELAPVEHRPAQPGDVVVLDMDGRRDRRDPARLRRRGRHRPARRRDRGGARRHVAGRDQGGRVRARGRAEGDRRRHRQGDPGEGAAAARRRPRQGGERVRDARGAALRHRGAAARAARGRAGPEAPAGRGRRARRGVDVRLARADGRAPHRRAGDGLRPLARAARASASRSTWP